MKLEVKKIGSLILLLRADKHNEPCDLVAEICTNISDAELIANCVNQAIGADAKDFESVPSAAWPEDFAANLDPTAIQGGGVAKLVETAATSRDERTCSVNERELEELVEQRDELLAAAEAVIERWDSPLWKDVPSTAGYIVRLRAVVTEVKGGAE